MATDRHQNNLPILKSAGYLMNLKRDGLSQRIHNLSVNAFKATV